MGPTISAVIVTYNEESTIDASLTSLREAGAGEIVVVDGRSNDRTTALAARHPGVRIIEMPACRSLQMNAGARAVHGDVIVFLHSDVKLNRAALDAARAAMRDPAVIGGNFDIRYDGNDLAAASFTWINRLRRRCGIFYGDSGIFCRRAVFETLGGFAPWPILEDYHLARRLRKSGNLALLSESIQVSDRRWRKQGLLVTLCTWALIQGFYLLGCSPHRLARLYRHVR